MSININIEVLTELYYQYREELEHKALKQVCACLYYDLADCIVDMTDFEVIDILEGRYCCDVCGVSGVDGAQQ